MLEDVLFSFAEKIDIGKIWKENTNEEDNSSSTTLKFEESPFKSNEEIRMIGIAEEDKYEQIVNILYHYII